MQVDDQIDRVVMEKGLEAMAAIDQGLQGNGEI
jgi:hypothetical protein